MSGLVLKEKGKLIGLRLEISYSLKNFNPVRQHDPRE